VSQWAKTTLGSVSKKIGSGATPTGGSNAYKESGISLIRSQNVLDFKFSKNGLAFIDDKQAHELRNVIVEENDVLLNITGDSVARCCVVPTHILPARVNQHVAIIRALPEMADNRYIYYLLQSMKDELLMQAEIGATRNALTKGMLETLEISLPTVEEQISIASVLSSLDDKIDLLHRQNKTLEAMGETLFRQWFVEGAEEDWEEGTLSDFISVKHGYAFKGDFITTEISKQILVTPGNFKVGGGFKFGKMKYYSSADYPKDYVFSNDDLVVTMTDLSKEGDTLGYPALIPEHDQSEILYLHNQRVGKVQFKNNRVSKYFLYFLMKTADYQWFVLGSSSGTSVRHTSPTSICSYKFQIPPAKKMEEFHKIADGFITKTHKIQIQIQTLEKLRDGLLQKLMSGEVRVG
jgi:type I restriction enzyme S subunit